MQLLIAAPSVPSVRSSRSTRNGQTGLFSATIRSRYGPKKGRRSRASRALRHLLPVGISDSGSAPFPGLSANGLTGCPRQDSNLRRTV